MDLKEMRLKLNMTQKEFAGYIGIPVANISHWEQGYRKPPAYVVNLVARVIRVESNLV